MKRLILLSSTVLFICGLASAQENLQTQEGAAPENLLITAGDEAENGGGGSYGYSNPVLPGMHPDPSVCRVGEDFYLVNSTFQYFPGVPVYHSKDLVHWEAIGHCLTRTSQLNMPGAQAWGGIYAPTIRRHDGLFYMIVTNVSGRGNFIVTAEDPAGEWSEPVWVDRPGIDPDLFWDEDGRCYVTTNSMDITEIDPATGAILSEPVHLWDGSGGRYPEGPHIYKKDGWYYMMIAEGGTEYGHKETIARSKSLFGPYEGNPSNPILTHACPAGAESVIQGTGHADLVQAADGSWWMVCLAFRTQSDTHHLLGRETFLAPVQWDEEGWPVVNLNGTISTQMDCPTLPQVKFAAAPERDNFDGDRLGFEWNTLCRPHPDEIALTESPGRLRLHATATTLDEPDSPVFLGRRQEHICFQCTAAMDISGLQDGASAGLTTYMTDAHHYDLCVTRRDGRPFLALTFRLRSIRHLACEIPLDIIPGRVAASDGLTINDGPVSSGGSQSAESDLDGNMIYLRIEGDNDYYSYYYSLDGEQFEFVGRGDTRFLSTETASGFTGIYLGLFAQQDPTASDVVFNPSFGDPDSQDPSSAESFADFDWFEYKPL